MKKKVLRTLKMTAYYSFLCLILQGFIAHLMFAAPLMSQNLYNTKISTFIEDVTLGEAFKHIEEKTNFKFLYIKEEIPINDKVTINAKDESLYNVLQNLASEYSLVFNTINDQIIVKKVGVDSPELFDKELGAIKGQITDIENNEPLIGANILIKGTSIGTTSDKDGNYSIPNLEPGNYTIIVKYVGYIEKAESVSVSPNRTLELNFQLRQAVVDMNDVVVTGYMTATEKRKLDTPVSVLTAKDIERMASPDFQDLLQGYIPGAVATNLGQEGFNTLINIRGAASLETGTVKIYVDGVELANPQYINTIDPNSIERVEVTRGVGASTLYGSDAGGGVIQVFTKKGHVGSKLRLTMTEGITNSPYVSSTPVKQFYNADYSGGLSTISYNFGGTYRKEDPVAPTPKANIYSTSAHAGFRASFDPIVIDFNANYSETGRGAQTKEALFSDEKYPAKLKYPYYYQRQYKSTTLGTDIKHIAADWWVNQLTVGYSNLDYAYYGIQARYTSASDTTVPNNQYIRQKVNVRYNATFMYPQKGIFQSKLTVGAEWSQNNGVEAEGRSARGAEGIGLTLISGTLSRDSYNYGGYFAQWQPSLWDKLFLTVGVRVEYSDLYGEDFGTPVSPRIGLAYNIKFDDLGLLIKPRISYGKGIKAPPRAARLGDVYSYYIYTPNPDIGPETQIGGDAGVDVYAMDGKLNFEASYYNQTAKDLISTVRIDMSEIPYIWMYQNIGEVKNTGCEFSLRYTFGDFLISASYTVASSKIMSLSSDYIGTMRAGDQINYLPRNTENIRVTYTFSSVFGHGNSGSIFVELNRKGSWRGLDMLSYYADLYGVSGESLGTFAEKYTVDYDPIAKVNMAVSYKLSKKLGTFVQVSNLTNNTDPEYYNTLLYEGRTIRLGASLTLDL